MTNLPGILVLGLAKAQLIQIFFFRLNLLITVLGLLHGLVFLPVILSYLGERVGSSDTARPLPHDSRPQAKCHEHTQPCLLGTVTAQIASTQFLLAWKNWGLSLNM